MGEYDDIINLPHHVSIKHPHMEMLTRAAQFSPFAALTGYDDAIDEAKRLTVEKIELDESEKEKLDEKLHMLSENIPEYDCVQITYFVEDERKSGGKYVTVKGKVAKINTYDKIVVMEDNIKIKIDDIIRIDFGGN